ncbi:unnamed protein product [Heterobilharzia americana]|nr:unnamed protein product [Heterobilharzia americana]
MDIKSGDDLIGVDFDVDIPIERNVKKRTKFSEAKKYRSTHSIKISVINKRSKIPKPVKSFRSPSCHFNDVILHNLSDLAYKTPTPIQAQGIPIMMQHRNLLACAPTGSGKTAAYLLPVLNQLLSTKLHESSKSKAVLDEEVVSDHKIFPFAVVLAPTQELMHQIRSEALRLCREVQSDYYIATLSRKHYSIRCKKSSNITTRDGDVAQGSKNLRELKLPANTKILISTPSRLSTLLSLPYEQCPFDFSRLSWLVVDECDKMLEVNLNDISHSNSEHVNKGKYRPRGFHDQLAPVFKAIQKVSSSQQTNVKPAIALFSATVPNEVVSWTKSQLPILLKIDNSEPELIQLRVGVRNAAVSTVKQELRYCATEQGKLLEMHYLLANILANVISSDKTEAQRANIVRAFREGQLHVLICTDLLGRGIDKGVSMVVNYDVTPSKQEYIHRIGRTGRAGRHGRAITLWTDSDLPHMDGILSVMKKSGSEVDPELDRLVNEWKIRRVNMMCKKTNHKKQRFLYSSISRRRGERRLAAKILKNSSKENVTETTNIQDKSMWLRPWNPHRGRISDVPGALSKKQKTE